MIFASRLTVGVLGIGLGALVSLHGCDSASSSANADLTRRGDPEVSYQVISGSLAADPDIEALIEPYRAEYEARTVEIVGEAAGPFTRGDPESALDNLAADALLESARRLSSRPVDLAMMNDGGLRADLNAGPISLGEVFEIVPFENMISVIDLTGYQLDSLVYQIARTRGEPVAGIRFHISSQPTRAFDIEVGGEPLDSGRVYRVAVLDYLANGGGSWPQVWTPIGREDFPYLIRDAILDLVRERGQIQPYLDGRIRVGTP